MADDGRAMRAVVTGGTGALGRHVVRHLLDEGWRISVPWHDEGEARELEGRSAPARASASDDGGGRLLLGRADATDADSVEAFLSDTVGDGPLHLLCNLVGGFAMGELGETDPSTWHRMMELNATSAFVCTRAALPRLRRAPGAAVVNVAAFPAVERGTASMSAYAASKAAVVSLTRSLADELAEDRITVNAVAPEIIDTPANREAMPDADRSSWLAPAEIARVIGFLAGEDARIVTGSVLMLSKAGGEGS